MLKSIVLILSILTYLSINGYAQTVRSVTQLESSSLTYAQNENTSEVLAQQNFSYLDNINFEQTLFWRKKYDKDFKEKDSYFFHSIYLKDSVVGVKYFGYDFNFMHERFDKPHMNHFRQWNCIRVGFALSVEHNPFEELHPLMYVHEYLNANLYFKYYHIPKSARGDKTTRFRKWAWGFFVEAEYFGRLYGDLHVKPFNFVWVHARYKKELNDDKYAAFIIEWELNKYGYSHCEVESTKDLYHGVTVFLGPEYNLDRKTYALNFGLSMKFRNH